MEWYYAEGNQPRGPVPQEEFERLVRAGTVRSETLVWRAGMANWQPYRTVVPGDGEASAQGGLVCSGCGQVFAPDQVVRRENAWVCGPCRTSAVPGGGELVGVGGGEARRVVSEEEFLSRDYPVQISECLNRSWELMSAHAGLLIGATALVYLVLVGSGMIPFVGSIASLVLGGPLLGGLWWLYLRRLRGGEVSVGDAFSGFGPDFGQLLLGYVVPQLLSYLCLLPVGVAMIALGITSGLAGGENGLNAVSGAVGGFVVLLALVGIAGAIYLQVSWFFALPLIIDKRLRFWPAMVLSRKRVGQHFWGTLLLLFVAWLLLMVGALLCFVGVLVTGPLAKGLVTYHYETVFGNLPSATD